MGRPQPRIDREEDIDSKISDTNNYFADPIARSNGRCRRSFERSSRQARENDSDDRSGFKIRVHQSTDLFETQQREKEDLAQSILFDTFTPEFTPEKMAGLGTLSGEAIKRAMVLGYIKRENNKEIYDIAVDRGEKSYSRYYDECNPYSFAS